MLRPPTRKPDMNSLTLTPQQAELVRELGELRSQLADLRYREKPLRDALLGLLQDAEASVALTAAGSQVAHLETQVRVKVQRDKLEGKQA